MTKLEAWLERVMNVREQHYYELELKQAIAVIEKLKYEIECMQRLVKEREDEFYLFNGFVKSALAIDPEKL